MLGDRVELVGVGGGADVGRSVFSSNENFWVIAILGHSISNQRKIKCDSSRFLSNLVRSEYS